MEYNEMIRGLAKQFGMEAEPFANAVKAQCFPNGAASDYQLTHFLMVCADRQLNPFSPGEVYCFVNKQGKLVIGTGIDGWIKIVHRHKDFAGYEATEVYEGEQFAGVEMVMYHKGWEKPGKYTAYLAEWNVNVLNVNGWKTQPRHLTFNKAFQECARFTFSINDVVGLDDIERIRAGEEATNVIRQPAPEPQRTIEHNPAERADFIKTGRIPEAVAVHADPARADGHLKVHVELPGEKIQADAGSTPADVGGASTASTEAGKAEADRQPLPPSRKGRPAGSKNKPKGLAPGEDVRDEPSRENGFLCWVCGDPSVEITSDFAGPSYGNCATHKGQEPPNFKERCEQALRAKGGKDERDPAVVAAQAAQAADAAQENGAGAVAPDTGASDAQTAAGLEVIDPNERPLETFCRAHDVPQRRIDMALSKYGAATIAELTPDQAAAILGIFERSLKINQATA